MSTTFLTIGHSTHSIEEFLDLLDEAGASGIVDVRKLPGSNKFPHFNADPLKESLANRGLDYLRFEGLNGRRKVSKTVPFEVNAFWQNRSFHNYADHALGEEFAEALQALRDSAGDKGRLALMCSEAVWWRCHRRIITDHLIAGGDTVLHIMGSNNIKQAELNFGAVLGEDRKLRYPPTNTSEQHD